MLITVHVSLLVIDHVVLELVAKRVIGVVFVRHEFRVLDVDNTPDKLKDRTLCESFRHFSNDLTPRSTAPMTAVLLVPRPRGAGSLFSLRGLPPI